MRVFPPVLCLWLLATGLPSPAHATEPTGGGAAAGHTADTATVDAEVAAFDAGLVAAVEAHAKGDPLAAAEVGELFYRFEESTFRDRIAAKDPDLYARLEKVWLDLRRAMKTGAPAATVQTRLETVRATLEAAHRKVQGGGGLLAAFLGAFLIILREGFEALLVVAALAAWLRRAGGGDRVRWLYGGAAAAALASLLLWAAARTLISISGAQGEVLEGATMLLASAVLFYVSYWLVSKAQHAKWDAFIRRTAGAALAGGGALAMFGVAFLVVFREGFETVLFYEALLQSSKGQAALVGAGFASGLAVLLALYALIRLAGMKLPFGLFFGATGGLLYLLAVKFAGDGVRELQAGGLLGETPLGWLPDSATLQSWFGIHPYLETVAPQLLLLLLAAVAGVVLLRRRHQSPALTAEKGGAAHA